MYRRATHVQNGASPKRLRQQRGLGMLEVLLFVFVLSGLVLAGYLGWRERTALQTARIEKSTLSQADQAVITFATVMRRLPCPDTDRDGAEDCGANAQKGWLPSNTLRLAGADPGVAIGQLRYLVQRGATEYDLATLSDSWRPLEYDDSVPTFAAMRDTIRIEAGQHVLRLEAESEGYRLDWLELIPASAECAPTGR